MTFKYSLEIIWMDVNEIVRKLIVCNYCPECFLVLDSADLSVVFNFQLLYFLNVTVLSDSTLEHITKNIKLPCH